VSIPPIRHCLDGRWLAPGEAAFGPTSGLVSAGEGWFETLRVEEGRPMFLAAHLQRLSRSVTRWLGGLAARDALQAAQHCLSAMAAAFGDHPSGRLRLLVAPDTGGGHWQALGEWGPQVSSRVSLGSGISTVIASFPHPGLGVLGKSASYHWSIAARREAVARGAGEALLVRDGRLLEAATGTLVWRRDGRWCAEDSQAVLPSVTLATLRGCGVEILSGILTADDLRGRMDEAAARSAEGPLEGLVLVSALRLAVAVREVDGCALPTEVALAAAAGWRDRLLARHAAGEA